jgi:hypothetical protein
MIPTDCGKLELPNIIIFQRGKEGKIEEKFGIFSNENDCVNPSLIKVCLPKGKCVFVKNKQVVDSQLEMFI